ncbi:hypothetical protein SUDANB95_04116 [Actinosynnema sp. ALI-1.44]
MVECVRAGLQGLAAPGLPSPRADDGDGFDARSGTVTDTDTDSVAFPERVLAG